jgi:mannose-1-phosphate guanylyltransferase
VERETFPRLLAEGKRIAVYRGNRYWIDLGTPEKYIGLHRDIFAGRFSMLGADFRRERFIGLGKAQVDKTAVLRGPVYLGENVRVGAGAVIGPNVVIGADSVIGEKCIVENSILWEGINLEENCRVSGSIITAGCSVPYGTKLIGRIYTDTVQEHTAV